MRNYSNGFLIWDDDLERELFTEREIKANNKRVAKMLKRIERKGAVKMSISEWLAELGAMTPEEKLQTVELTSIKFYKGIMVLSWSGVMGFGEYRVELDEDETTFIGHSEGMDIKKPNKEFLRHLLNQLADRVDLTEEIACNEDWKRRNGN